MAVFRKTWLATTLFVLVSTAVWWELIGWSAAWKRLLPTLLLTPLVWWLLVGQRPKPRLWRGIVGGALAGLVTQSAQDIPKLWGFLVRGGAGNGEEQAIAIASVTIYLLIGVYATSIGALLGLVALVVQRRMTA